MEHVKLYADAAAAICSNKHNRSTRSPDVNVNEAISCLGKHKMPFGLLVRHKRATFLEPDANTALTATAEAVPLIRRSISTGS